MIIDFHTHVFSDKIAQKTIEALANLSGSTPYTNGTVDGLTEAIKKANIDLAVTFPVLTKPTQFDGVNNFALELNQKKLPIISFAGIHPACENIDDKMLAIKNMGFKGVKIHPDYQATFIDDKSYIEILNCASELDLIVTTHAGVDDGFPNQPVRCTPDRVLNVLKQVKNVKLILAHMGGSRLGEEVLEKLCGKDVYFDTSFSMHFMDKNLFRNIVNKHGADKLLFATDSPWRDIGEEVNILQSMGLSSEQQDKIFYKNAKTLLKI